MKQAPPAGAPESKQVHHGAPKQQFSSRNNPCPICGGDDGSCMIEPSGVICNHHPPDGRWEGDHRKGRDGRYWNFRARDDDGRAVFLLHHFCDHTPQNLEDVSGHLREAITENDLSVSELQQLVAQLAAKVNQPLPAVQRIAEAICKEHHQVAEIQAEVEALAAEADRQHIGQRLTLSYLLPAKIAAAVEISTRYLPCDGPSAVLAFLTGVAGLVKLGTKVEGCAAAGYYVTVNLFGCAVAPSGAKKTPLTRRLVDDPIQDLKAELTTANDAEMQQWHDACHEIKKGRVKQDPPILKRLVVSDYTGEALTAQLEVQEAAGLGLLIHREELSGLFGSLNQYRAGKGADEQQLLELFDGGGLTSLRVSGHRTYSRSQVSIWGTTQPDVLRELVKNGDASGLWARFLFVPLPVRVVPLPPANSPADMAEVEAADATLADACRAVHLLPPKTYRLAPAAYERFRSYEAGRQEAAHSATIGAQSAVYGKSAGKVLRVAGLLHLLQIAADEANTDQPINADTIDRATALVDHLDAWALGLHSDVAAGGVGELLRTIHRTAEASGKPIRWKEVQNRLTKAQRKETDAAAAAEAMRSLARAGYGEVETGQRGGISYRATRPLP